MRKIGHRASLAPTLDDLLSDSRLARLFSNKPRDCALQLWILQIKSEQSIENRIVYGRLLPYSFSNGSWSATDDDNFQNFGEVQAQIVRLNLYIKTVHCAELLRQLSAGRTISAISEELELKLSDKLKQRFGETVLPVDGLVYRPVTYLLNRDAFERNTPSSPHGGAGALSAAIARSDKVELFRVTQGYDVALTKSVVKHLNADTGLNFGGTDAVRFGDLELMVFPALDDQERPLLSINWRDDPFAIVVRFNPIQVPHFSDFQFRLSIANDRQITYSGFAAAERDDTGVFECKFMLSEQLHAITDSTELEVFGFDSNQARQGELCCRWRSSYIREIQFQGHAVGRRGSSVKFDWLEKATRPSTSARVKAALTITRGDPGFASRVGGREADPWVPGNRDLESLFERLHPPKSEGRFFQRWGRGDGEGRLQFVEWFKKLLANHRQHQVVIFDPYFETAGLGLLLICAAAEANYLVFTSLPKPSKASEASSDEPASARINNLMASCELNREQLKRIRLRIYGMKEGRLHDRYILVMASDGLPAAGFHLSNSFQKAAENFPLLITPIPPDTLLEVEQYKSDLVREAEAAQPEAEIENSSMRLLFDSKASPTVPRRYEPLRFLEKEQAGDVLSVWTGEPSLQSLSGVPLKERLAALHMLKDGTLALPEAVRLHDWLNKQAGDFADFAATWEVLGELLAHSHSGDARFDELVSEREFLEFLARFLEESFNRMYDGMDKELAVIDAQFFGQSVESLLHSSYQPHHMFYATKYAALTWPEYFAIKLLWLYDPAVLVSIAEIQIAKVPPAPEGPDAVRLSLLSQIVSEISLSTEFNINEVQRGQLIHSKSGSLRWMGLNAIERELERPEGFTAALRLIDTFPYPEQVQVLGWMINHAARNPQKAQVYDDLVAAMHGALPTPIPAIDLRRLVDSMRGHMKQLSWAEPWLFQDVVARLLENGRANTDDACEIWLEELARWLESEKELQLRLFERARQGQTTNIAAFLFANSSPERRQASLNSMQAILKRHGRIVRQPLASTSDWTRWDDALMVAMWILAFTLLAQYYMRQRTMTDSGLEELSLSARELAMVRSMSEWRSRGPGRQGELPAFLDQVEELLAPDAQSESG